MTLDPSFVVMVISRSFSEIFDILMVRVRESPTKSSSLIAFGVTTSGGRVCVINDPAHVFKESAGDVTYVKV